MAKNKHDLDAEDLELRTLDLESIDDDFSYEEPQEKSPIRRFTAEFKRGFLEQTKAKVLLKNFIRSSLPDGYSRLWALGESAPSDAQQMADDVQREVGPELDNIAEQMEANLPKIRKHTPTKLYNKIESGVSRFREDQAYQNRAYPSEAQQQADADDARLAEVLDSLEEGNASDTVTDRLEVKERRLRDKMEQGRFDVLNHQLDRVGQNLEHQVSYQDQITYKYQRKSLEVQYRTFFALRDMRKYAEVNQKTQEQAFSALVHNTGLPDHLKQYRAERVRFGVQESLTSALGDQIASSLPGYLANFYPEIRDRLKEKLVEGVRLGDSMVSGASMADSMGADGVGMAGNLAGETAGNFVKDTLLSRAALAARPGMEQLSDKLGGRHHMVSYFLNNLPAILQEYTQDYSQSGSGLRGIIHSLVSSVAPSFFLEDQLKDSSFQTIDKQTAFNQLTQRSIVEVIPGYLSRLLHETRMMRTGRDDLDREVYDITTGRFTGNREARGAMQKRIINETQRRNIDATLTQSVAAFDPENYLSEDAQAALRERLMRDASTNGYFEPTAYAEGQGFASDTREDTLEELRNFFSAQFDFDDEGNVQHDADSRRRLDAFSNAFLEVRNAVPDPRVELQRLAGAGVQEVLHDLGLITSDYGQTRVNYDKVWDLYRSKNTGSQRPRRVAKGGDIPRTHVKASYEDDTASLSERFNTFKEDLKEQFRFKKPELELPKMTDDLVRRLPELDNETLAKLALWDPELIKRVERTDPEIKLRLAPYIRRLEKQQARDNTKIRLDRDMVDAVWTLVDQAEKSAEPSPEAHEPTARSATTNDTSIRWDYEASRRAEATRQRATTPAEEPTRPTIKPPVGPTTEFYGFQPAAASMAQQRTEYDRYLEEIQSLQHQQLQQSNDFFTRLSEEMERGFKIREIPAMLIRDGSGDEADQYAQYTKRDADADAAEDENDGWWNAFKAGGRAVKGSAKRWGRTFKSGAEVTGKLYTDMFAGVGKGVGSATAGIGRGVGSVAASFGYQTGKFIRDPTPDIYLMGRPDEPVLLARDLDRKRYIDTKTNKVIKRVSDIKGEVWDTHENRIALTAGEIAEGIYDKRGKSLARQAAESVIDFYKNVYLKPSAMMLKQLPKLGDLAKDFIVPKRDAFIPGEKKPRIRANLMDKGFYFDEETQEPILSYSDINGTVVDRQGNVVVDEAEVPQLVGRDGRPLESIGTKLGSLGRKAAKIPFKMIGAGLRGAKTVAKNAWKLGAAVSEQVVGALGRLTGFKYTPGGNAMGSDKKVVTLLGGIYDLLLERLPETKKHRKGSWQEEFAKRDEEREEEKDFKEEMGWREDGVFGSIGKRLGGLMAMFQDREETLEDIAENTEDMDGGGTDIFAGGGGDGPDGKKPRGKRPKKPVPKGFWNKLKHFGGKGVRGVGRGIGALGRGALSLVGLGGAAGGIGHGLGALGRGAMTAGRFALGGAGTALRLGGTAAAAAVSALGAPVVLGGAAVAGAATAGWFWWKGRKVADGPFRQLRLTQYGFEPGGFNSEAKKLAAMEAVLEKAVVRQEGEVPTFNMNDLDVEAFFEAMEVDTDSEEQLLALGEWFEGRAKPIYMAYQKALMDHAPNATLAEMDNEVDKDVGMKVLRVVKFPYSGNTPYQYLANPFDPEEPIEVTEQQIKEKEEAVKEVYDGTETARERTQATTAAAGTTASIAASVNQAVDNGRQMTSRTRVLGQAGHTAAQVVAGGSAVDMILASQRSHMPNYRSTATGRLTSLQAMRVRAYGVVDLQRTRVMALLGLEDTVQDYLSFEGNGTASFEGSSRDIFREVSGLFGLSITGVADNGDLSDEENFTLWFKGRFLPTYLAFASALRQTDASATLANGERSMTATQKAAVGNAIMSATYTNRGDEMAVWVVPYTIFDDPNVAAARQFAQKDLDLLKQQVQDDRMGTETQSAAELSSTVGGNQTLSAASVDAALAVSGGGRGTPPTSMAAQHRNASQRAVERARNRWGMGGGNGYGTPGVQPPRRSGGRAGARGNTFSGIVQGNGGMWEEIPMPEQNRSKDAAMPTLLAVQDMTGVDANLLATFASIESAFDYQVKASTSSATGWFQFINATWDGMIERHADKYGIPHSGMSTGAIRNMRKDPRINALMGAEFLKGNYNYLEDKLGRKPTDTDLYLAHFFGAGTAYKFLNSDQNAIAARLFSQQASANRPIFYKSSGQPRTIGEVYAVLDEKVSGHRFGDTGVNVNRAAANDEPDPVHAEPGSSQTAGVIEVDGEPMRQLGPSGMGEPGSHMTSASPANDGAATSQGSSRRSLNARASATVNPYNQAGSGGVTSGTRTGGGMYGEVDAGMDSDDPVVTHRERLREQAEVADRRQRHQSEESRVSTREMGRLLTRQLEVQQTMSGYLREIAENITGAADRDNRRSEEETQRTNDTSRPPERSRTGGTRHRRAPVSMSRQSSE